MAYVDLTTFTKVDEANFWTLTESSASCLMTYGFSDYSYIYKDYGIDFFGLEFNHIFDTKLISANFDYNYDEGRILCWGVLQTPGNIHDIYYGTNGIIVEWYIYKEEGTYKKYLRLACIDTSSYDYNGDLDFDTTYYIRIQRTSSTTTCKIYLSALDRTYDINIIDTLSIDSGDTYSYRYLQCGATGWEYFDGTLSSLNQNFELNTSPEPTEELLDLNNDFRMILPPEEIYDIVNDFRMIKLEENIDIINDFRSQKLSLENINNKFNSTIQVIEDIRNKINIRSLRDLNNIINVLTWTKSTIININNDFRTKLKTSKDVLNDFRMVSAWQLPGAGEVGFQSLGKPAVKVYISDVEQTDVDVDSISFTLNLNSPSVASFDLGRAYDNTKPNTKSLVRIEYNDILLYKGYITQIAPTDNPETIKISCQDAYWYLNLTKKYFLVGRKPSDAKEYYYLNIKEALEDLSFNIDIGDFIPQTIDLYGRGIANCISELVENSGNFAWFIKPDGTKILWTAGYGSLIDLPVQELGNNLGLYQVINLNIRESIENIVNRFRVIMGSKTAKQSSQNPTTGQGTSTYNYIIRKNVKVYGTPVWNSSLEILARNSANGYGYDWQDPDEDYKDVFRKFYLPDLNPILESWSDKYPPLVEIIWGDAPGWTNRSTYLTDGFSLDYGFKAPFSYPSGASDLTKPSITFSEPQVVYDTDAYGSVYRVRPKIIRLYLWKELKYTYTVDEQTSPDDAPEESEDNDLMFYTEKMGDYADTILETLNLSNFSKQEGYTLRDEKGNIIQSVPSWNDREFAEDYANWQLSKNCDKKYEGTIDLTIDALIQYNIDLSKRVQIKNILDPINITSISVNFGSFIATLSVESNRYYHRSISLPPHGE